VNKRKNIGSCLSGPFGYGSAFLGAFCKQLIEALVLVFYLKSCKIDYVTKYSMGLATRLTWIHC